MTNIFFVKKIMHNFKIEFSFDKTNFKSNPYLGCMYLMTKNKSIFKFNDKVLDTQRFDKKIIII